MFRFWLDVFKPQESELVDTIESLKNNRSFTQTIRDGIRLICDLREGKLDVLFELFPWVRAEFLEYMRELQPRIPSEPVQTQPTPSRVDTPSTPETDRAWIEAEQERLDNERRWHEKRMADAEKALEAERQRIEKERTKTQNSLQERLDRLEELLLQQGNQPITGGLTSVGGAGGNPGTGPKALTTPTFKPPSFDDEDDLDLNISKDTNSGAQAVQNFLSSINQLNH